LTVQLVSKISNLCDPDPPTLQTDRRTDGQHAISIPRYALVHRAVKKKKQYLKARNILVIKQVKETHHEIKNRSIVSPVKSNVDLI